ncbi:MAG: hypothetical protein IOD01_04195 [Rhodobacter sp.]|nr:hypothetical protein [Rhodobacter sp.]
MSDLIIAEAIARRDAAAAEMRRWDEFIAMYREIARPKAQERVFQVTADDAVGVRGSGISSTGILTKTDSVAIETIRAVGDRVP